MMTQIKHDYKKNIVFAILLFLSVIATVTKILVGFDIDEAYAVTMPYRLLQKDSLFLDMWEVHQTSSFVPFIMIALFMKITKDTTYLVLFMRVTATIIHLLISAWCYSTLKKYYDKYIALFIALVYYNFLPKWMMNLDFSMQQLWFMTISIILLFYAVRTNKSKLLFGAGVVLAMAVLAYPGMLLLYPCYLIVIWIEETENKSRLNNCITLTAGCAITAVLFFTCILSQMSVSEFLASIPMVFSDGSHQFTFATKLGMYGKQWMEVLVQAFILLIPSAVLTVLWCFLQKSKSVLLNFSIVFLVLSSGIVICANLLGIKWGPFRLQVRYLIMFVLAFLIYNVLRKSKDEAIVTKVNCIFRMLLVTSIGMFAGILIASNVGPVSSASYLVLADIAFLLLLYELYLNDVSNQQSSVINRSTLGRLLSGKYIYYGAVVLFLLSLIMCKGYYVRITEYAPSNILEERVEIKSGAAKGIWVSAEDYERIMDNYDTIINTVHAQDKILFLGTESLNNLAAADCGAWFVSPTTISTPAFNEQWTAYFEMHKDKQPDLIFIAKNTIDNRDKFFAQNPFGMWIAKHYDVANMTETEYLCVLHCKKS